MSSTATARRSKSPFATAKEVEPEAKGTTFLVDDPDIKLFNELTAKIKELTAKQDEVKARLRVAADHHWLHFWVGTGRRPPAPIRLESTLDSPKQRVTFVVQDRTTVSPVPEGAINDLEDSLGIELDAADVQAESVSYAFNPDVLALRVRDPKTQRKDTLQALIGRELAPLLATLVAEEELTREQADSLLTVKRTCKYAAELLDRIGKHAGANVDRLRRAVAALGSAVVRYVQAG